MRNKHTLLPHVLILVIELVFSSGINVIKFNDNITSEKQETQSIFPNTTWIHCRTFGALSEHIARNKLEKMGHLIQYVQLIYGLQTIPFSVVRVKMNCSDNSSENNKIKVSHTFLFHFPFSDL